VRELNDFLCVLQRKERARKDQAQTMLREACLTKGAMHANMAAVTAVSLQDTENHLVPLVMYAVDSGDCHNLKTFLHRCRIAEVSKRSKISPLSISFIINYFTFMPFYFNFSAVEIRVKARRFKSLIDDRLIVWFDSFYVRDFSTITAIYGKSVIY